MGEGCDYRVHYLSLAHLSCFIGKEEGLEHISHNCSFYNTYCFNKELPLSMFDVLCDAMVEIV